MARYRHRPVWKAAIDPAVHPEKVLRRPASADFVTVLAFNPSRCFMIAALRFMLAVLACLLALPALAAFTDNGDGTITDSATGLMWDKCTWGQAGNGCTGAASTHTWSAALGIAVTANSSSHKGYSDWRLPNINELESLVDMTKATGPTIDATVFPNTSISADNRWSPTWSSTTYSPNLATAWCVLFYNGGINRSEKTGTLHVRLVRSGQSFGSFDSMATSTVTPAALSASLTPSATSGSAPLGINFAGSGSSTVSSDALTYAWSFGDGTTGVGQNASHTYTAAGSYTVTLTVSNTTGQTATATRSITVTAVPVITASFTSSVTTGIAPLAVSLAGSGSSTVSSDVLTYAWDFGDGTSGSGQNASHTYTMAGSYTVTLTTRNTTGQTATATRSITVTAVPVITASFTADVSSGTAPLTVNFTNTSRSSNSSDRLDYCWSFGDLGTAVCTPDANPSHTYTTAGTYTVTLIVSNASGSQSTRQTLTVAASSFAANFNYAPTSPTTNVAVTFVDTSSGTISQRCWDFGDGGLSVCGTLNVVNHTYAAAGNYTVRLTIADNNNQSTTGSQSVPVGASSQVSFMYQPATPTILNAASFTNTSQGLASRFCWDFGDQSPSECASTRAISHVYSATGTYTVTAIMEMANGQTLSGQRSITVSQQSIPVTGVVRLRPQVIMAGFDPILIDNSDTRFKSVAIVRPGVTAVTAVRFQNDDGSFAQDMAFTGTYGNGDSRYEFTLTYPQGALQDGFVAGSLFGVASGQFSFQIVDMAQNTHSFPNLEVGDNPAFLGVVTSSSVSVSATQGPRRTAPQVLAAGIDPELVDVGDNNFDVLAMVRAGTSAVQTVRLIQGNSSFELPLTLLDTLPNGDQKWGVSIPVIPGSLTRGTRLSSHFGNGDYQFMVEAIDSAGHAHRWPELRVGNWPAQ